MKNSFFNQLSIECGLTSIQSTQQFYNGLVRLFIRELKQRGQVELPHLGRFELRVMGESKPRVFKGAAVTPYKALKYVTNRQLKERMKLW